MQGIIPDMTSKHANASNRPLAAQVIANCQVVETVLAGASSYTDICMKSHGEGWP